MSEPDVTHIVAGSGVLYVAPLGTALPVAGVHGEYPVVWTSWIPVGYTDAGIDFVYTPSIKEIMVDELAAPVLDVLTTEKAHIAAHLAEASLANLNRAISASTFTDNSLTLGDINLNAGSQPLSYMMVGVQCPAPGTNKARILIFYKAITNTAVSLKIQRKDKVVIPVQFEARQLSGQHLWDAYDFAIGAS